MSLYGITQSMTPSYTITQKRVRRVVSHYFIRPSSLLVSISAYSIQNVAAILIHSYLLWLITSPSPCPPPYLSSSSSPCLHLYIFVISLVVPLFPWMNMALKTLRPPITPSPFPIFRPILSISLIFHLSPPVSPRKPKLGTA